MQKARQANQATAKTGKMMLVRIRNRLLMLPSSSSHSGGFVALISLEAFLQLAFHVNAHCVFMAE